MFAQLLTGAALTCQTNRTFTLKTAVTLARRSRYAVECCRPLLGCHSFHMVSFEQWSPNRGSRAGPGLWVMWFRAAQAE